MARTFEFGMLNAIRSQCSNDLKSLQYASKAPLLHMFDVHTNCNDNHSKKTGSIKNVNNL
jgi:hypothetical protein